MYLWNTYPNWTRSYETLLCLLFSYQQYLLHCKTVWREGWSFRSVALVLSSITVLKRSPGFIKVYGPWLQDLFWNAAAGSRWTDPNMVITARVEPLELWGTLPFLWIYTQRPTLLGIMMPCLKASENPKQSPKSVLLERLFTGARGVPFRGSFHADNVISSPGRTMSRDCVL